MTRDKEPLGHRIIEIPKDIEQFESRDARSEFIAYAPIGSVKKGESLAKSGENGKTIQCVLCHGADLKRLWASARNRGPFAELSGAPAL